MKTFNVKLVSALAMALLLAACKSTPMTKPTVEDKSVGKDSSSTTTGATTGSADDGSGVKEVNLDNGANADDAGNPLKDPNNILSKRHVYFAFDSDAVNAEFRPLIEAHAKYLLANKGAKVILQGNTDERGTREYNLALGQRRSVAVKKSLNALGVQDGQIETVSYGEEKTQGCADETCFAKDRRTDIVYEGE
ncbi:MAG TPA: OmpA family protein [Methylotenera sp.]|nr:OmpA family protein [Methylotenera sp.]HPH05399.1 OmpA family protein [Methylotenera sp.]HPN01534.1 OmpA family protein [Methylotenera sp.]